MTYKRALRKLKKIRVWAMTKYAVTNDRNLFWLTLEQDLLDCILTLERRNSWNQK